jgi:hypothetical protein
MTFAASGAPSGELSGALARDFTGGAASPGPLSQVLPRQGPHGPLGVLICGHGSRNRLAVAEFADLADKLRQGLAPVPLEYGYLEFARPILREVQDIVGFLRA